MSLPVTPASGTCLSEGAQGKQRWRSIPTCHHGMSTPLDHPENGTSPPQALLHQQVDSVLLPGMEHSAPCRNHSAGGLSQETHGKPWCAFLLGGLEEPEWP